MEAKELMIGDWVETLDGISKVVSIHDAFHIEVGGIDYTYDEYQVSPIPITEEILKANFKPCAISNYYRAHRIEIHFWGESNATYTIKTADLAKVCIDYSCGYVHELQHALRLCGLNELADNFKV